MATSKSGLISEYLEAKKLASFYSEQERTLRIKIIEQFFPTAGEGTHTEHFKLWEIKGGIRYNYKFDKDALEEYEHLFNEKEAACVVRKPEFHLSSYRKLKGDDKKTIDSCVIVTPGLPTLEIKELPNGD